MGLRIFIVDQERTFADALASRLEAEGDITVVAAVSVELPALRPVVAQNADIMLLDADLPGGAALVVCREVVGRGIAEHVIMMSYSTEPERVVAAVRAGATAWMPKDESLQHLLHVMHGIARGDVWLPPAVAGHVLSLLLRAPAPQQENDLLLATLTPREREVLACLAEGAARREVAARLRLSANTVRTHLQHLMAKLRVHSTLEAVALARSALPQAHPQEPTVVNGRTRVACGAGNFISPDS